MTKIISVLIVEDEPIIADDIALSLEALDCRVTDIVSSADEALQSLKNELPDIVFLDIKLKGHDDGIRLAHRINELYRVPFVFITSLYDQNTLIRAKQAKPAGYIVKPFKEGDLKVNLEMALSKSRVPEITETEKAELNLFVRKDGAIIPLDFAEVTYVEADDNYSVFYTAKDKHVVSRTLKDVEDKLSDQGFCRVHKTFLINLRKVDRIEQSVLFIEGKMIPIGKVYKKPFLERLTVF